MNVKNGIEQLHVVIVVARKAGISERRLWLLENARDEKIDAPTLECQLKLSKNPVGLFLKRKREILANHQPMDRSMMIKR